MWNIVSKCIYVCCSPAMENWKISNVSVFLLVHKLRMAKRYCLCDFFMKHFVLCKFLYIRWYLGGENEDLSDASQSTPLPLDGF